MGYRPFGIHTINDMYAPDTASELPDGRWVKAVCEPYYGRRLLKAWWVLTGRAEAVVWPKDGDLERVLGAPDHPSPRTRKG